MCMTTALILRFQQNHSFVPGTLNVEHVVNENTSKPVGHSLFYGENVAKAISSQGQLNQELLIHLAANYTERGFPAESYINQPKFPHLVENSSGVSTKAHSHAASRAMVKHSELNRGADSSDHNHIAHFLMVIETLDQLGPTHTSSASSESVSAPTNWLAGENQNPATRPAVSIPDAP